MPTTPEMIERVKQMAASLPQTLVKDCQVDDWGRHGNFAILVTPVTHGRSTTAVLTGLLRRSAKSIGAQVRQVFPPEPIYRRAEGRRRLVGYRDAFWKFDVDFEQYDATTNTFSSQDIGYAR